MSNLLLFSIFFATLSILSTIFAITKGKEGLSIFLVFITVLGNVIIWGAIGCSYTVKREMKEIKCKVVKTDRATLVDDGVRIWEFTDHKDYLFINDSCKFFHTVSYNMYGGECCKELKVVK